MDKYQKQIDWLNSNLRREIEERLAQGDRYRLSAWFLDQRVEKLEKTRLANHAAIKGGIISA